MILELKRKTIEKQRIFAGCRNFHSQSNLYSRIYFKKMTQTKN